MRRAARTPRGNSRILAVPKGTAEIPVDSGISMWAPPCGAIQNTGGNLGAWRLHGKPRIHWIFTSRIPRSAGGWVFEFWLIQNHFSRPAKAVEHDLVRSQREKCSEILTPYWQKYFSQDLAWNFSRLEFRSSMFQNFLSVHLLKIEKSVTNGGRVRREVRSSWWTLAESARSH